MTLGMGFDLGMCSGVGGARGIDLMRIKGSCDNITTLLCHKLGKECIIVSECLAYNASLPTCQVTIARRNQCDTPKLAPLVRTSAHDATIARWRHTPRTGGKKILKGSCLLAGSKQTQSKLEHDCILNSVIFNIIPLEVWSWIVLP